MNTISPQGPGVGENQGRAETVVMSDATARFIFDVSKEVQRAQALHRSYSCAHHGYGVLLEEVDELWDEVRKKRAERNWGAMRQELVQIAAVCARFDANVVQPELAMEVALGEKGDGV